MNITFRMWLRGPGDAHRQGSAHDDEEVCQREVGQVLEEMPWELLAEKHDVGLHHTFTGGTPGDRPPHHVRLMRCRETGCTIITY